MKTLHLVQLAMLLLVWCFTCTGVTAQNPDMIQIQIPGAAAADSSDPNNKDRPAAAAADTENNRETHTSSSTAEETPTAKDPADPATEKGTSTGTSGTSASKDPRDTSPEQEEQSRGSSSDGPSRPHIVMIVADDLGWNDVSWRDKTMYTPVLSKLASEGVILNQAYVQPVCSPSRAAFMSGFYPYHLGMQHDSLRATQKAHLPDNITTLPQHLQKLGYSTHMAGKWHLGFCNWRYTPTYRGFDSFVGFYNAIQDYYTHIGHRNGYDFRHNKDVYYAANGTYSAFIFTQYIEQVIAQHDVSKPLFVYLPYQSVHGPLEVPQFYIDRYCSHIKNDMRRTHCGLVAALDEGVGNVTRALQKRGIFNDTLLLFTTDNGGPVEKASNNWPLRGSKTTLWEGGTRATAFLHGRKFLKRGGTTYDGVIHAVDWLPTLVEAAGGEAVTGLDGVSQWKSVVEGAVPSARTEFVYNIDELKNNSALRQGRYKLLQGNPGHPDGWYPPPKLQGDLDRNTFGIETLIQEDSELRDLMSELSLDFSSRDLNASGIFSILARGQGRGGAGLRTGEEGNVIVQMTSEDDVTKTEPYQLYDLEADPTEHHDVKDKYPDVFNKMRARLEEYRKSLVPANFPPHDPDSYPSNFNGVWSPGWC